MEGSREDYCSDTSSDCSDSIDHPWPGPQTIAQQGDHVVHQAPKLASTATDIDRQQLLSTDNGSHDHIPERKAEQESHNEIYRNTSSVITSNPGSLHQMTSLPSIEEGVEHQFSVGSDNVFDKVIPKTNECDMYENSGEALVQQEAENEVYEESQTGTAKSREGVIPCNNLPAVILGSCGTISTLSPSLQSEDQQLQGSKLVIGKNVDKSNVQKSQHFDHTAVQEENRHNIIDNMFGCDLSKLVEAEGGTVPSFLIKCTEEIEKRALSNVGIYRFSGNAKHIQELKQRIDQGIQVVFGDQDVNIISGVLKVFLRELPDPLIPVSLYDKIIEAGKLKSSQKITELKLCIKDLPKTNYHTLKYILNHLRK